MALNNQSTISNKQFMKVSSFSIDKDDLRRFCDKLQERSNAAAELEVSQYQKNELSDEQYENNKRTIRDGFLLKISITGKDGETLWGYINEVFNSPNFPNEVTSFFVDSQTALKVIHNYFPHNYFIIFLNFRKPRIFDLSVMPSHATPNDSNIDVNGYDPTWVNGVFTELKSFIEKRSSTFSKVHSHSFYDLLLLFLGLPIAFWICFKLSGFIESTFSSHSSFLINSIYLYVFIATIFMFRFLFHYLRWVCPLVEYRSKENMVITHRIIFGAIALSIISSFLYDILKMTMN